MFGKLKERLMGGASRLAGKTDLLEGIAAGAALVTYADGTASDEEVAATLLALESHATLGGAFRPHEIERA